MSRKTTMRRALTALALLLAILGFATSAAAQCFSGRINGSNFVASGTYNTFDASDSYIAYTLTVRNTWIGTCNYGLVFNNAVSPGLLGTSPNQITFTISATAGGSNIITTTPSNVAASAWLPVLNVPQNGNVTVTYYVNITRGQVVPPGTYSDLLGVWLYPLNSSGGIVAFRLHADNLTVTRTVPTSISVNIAGGGTTTTLDYGTLTNGEVRTVNIEARSNVNYQLSTTALNLGNLRLPTPYSAWSIPYTATLGGSSLNLASTTVLGPFGLTPYAGTTRALAATIGTIGNKRAGIYSDEITVSIQVAP